MQSRPVTVAAAPSGTTNTKLSTTKNEILRRVLPLPDMAGGGIFFRNNSKILAGIADNCNDFFVHLQTERASLLTNGLAKYYFALCQSQKKK